MFLVLVSELSPVMEATGKYDFAATAEDELSFRKGDIIKVCFNIYISSTHLQLTACTVHSPDTLLGTPVQLLGNTNC